MRCLACGSVDSDSGVLCEDCADQLCSPVRLIPDQIHATTVRRVDAVLVDRWGRPHALETRTLLGRQIPGVGITILDSSISRHHAHVAFDPATAVWTLRDLGSANGTYLNEVPITEATPLADRDRIGIGQVELYFIARPDLGELPSSTLASETIRDQARPTAAIQPPAPGEFDHEEPTGSGMQSALIETHEPTGGGGGVVVVSGKQVQLGLAQFELFKLLYQRTLADRDQPELVRGFVRSSELVGQLPWDATDPGDNNVKQLVRRTRKALVRAGIGDLIESRHRFGYRLRIVPAAS